MFAFILRPDEQAELLKTYFKPLVKNLKTFTFVSKSERASSLVENSNPSAEIFLFYMDTHDGFLYSISLEHLELPKQ